MARVQALARIVEDVAEARAVLIHEHEDTLYIRGQGVYRYNNVGNAGVADNGATILKPSDRLQTQTGRWELEASFAQRVPLTPSQAYHAASKQYVDDLVAGIGAGIELIEEKVLAVGTGNRIDLDAELNGDQDGTYYGEYCILDNAGGGQEGYLAVNGDADGVDGTKFKSIAQDGATRRDALWLWAEGGHPVPQPIAGHFTLMGRRAGPGTNGRFRVFNNICSVQWDGVTLYGGASMSGGIIDYALNITDLSIQGQGNLAAGSWFRLFRIKHGALVG